MSIMSNSVSRLDILNGHVIAFFAFDIGYEVDLDRISQLLPAQPIQPISRTKQTPSHLQYTKPPRTIPLGEVDLLPGRTGHIQATVFDFGAISISFRWPLNIGDQPCTLETLPELSKTLFNLELENEAWRHVRAMMGQLSPAIARPALSNLIEDYFVFVIERTEQPILATDLIEQHPSVLTRILRFETEILSREQEKDALSKAISYYPYDLALIDWNATILFDADYADTLNVLELLNVELLEARYMDAELDKRLEAYDDLAKKESRWMLPLVIPHRQTIRELSELRIEAALLSERIENALKLIGDLYLARIHKAVSERFYIGTWDEAISSKLNIIDDLYQFLSDRIGTSQAQTLELIIIILILIEILLQK
jgi:hypothetical protein